MIDRNTSVLFYAKCRREESLISSGLSPPLYIDRHLSLPSLCEASHNDGWGEGFEQRDIQVDGGYLNVHFYQQGDFRIQERHRTEAEPIPDKKRPKMKLLGHDSNIFSIMGDARKLLIRNGQGKEAEEMCGRVQESGNYYKALGIISEYVETELSSPQKSGKGRKKPGKGECR